jgi:glucose/arabinose dehydrogenase
MRTFFIFSLLTQMFILQAFRGHSQSHFFLKPFSSGFTQPTCIVNAGDSRLFITEQPGTVRIVDSAGNLNQRPFLDITDRVNSAATEQGLLGIAFHPQYSANGYFFLYYTGMGDSVRISRFSVSATDPDSALPSSEHRILTIYKPFVNHNGGDLQFGPDGYLYIGTGDGGSGGDPGNRAQDKLQLLGKMLRIDVDSGDPYSIPPTNPFIVSSSARGEIWALGLRNPWRFSFDRLTGDLWIGDVGQGSFEEINFQPASSPGGENYGWRCYEGFVPYNTTGCLSSSNYTFPVFTYPHNASDPCESVSGGYVYRGIKYPSMNGRYFFADYCTDDIWETQDSSGIWITRHLGTFTGNNFSTFGEDLTGEVFAAGLSSGTVFQLSDSAFSLISQSGEKNGILIQPNPTTGKIEITLDPANYSNTNLEINDIRGRKIFSMILVQNSFVLDLGFLKAGIYFLHISGKINGYAKLIRL